MKRTALEGEGVGVVLVGCGYIAQAEHIPGWQQEPLGRLVGVVDQDTAIASQVAAACRVPHFSSLGAAMESTRPDAVHICTPAKTHAALVAEALWAGADVLVEKPLTEDPESARALVELAGAEGRTLMVGAPRLYDPYIEFVSEAVKRGEIGEVFAISSTWRMSHAPSYPHITAMARHRAVTATPGTREWLRQRLLEESVHHLGVFPSWAGGALTPWSTVVTDRAFHITLKAPGDILITHTNVSPAGHGETFNVFGSCGRIEAMPWSQHFPDTGGCALLERSVTGEVVHPAIQRTNGYWAQLREFAEVILGRSIPRRSAEGAVADLALIDAIVDRLDDDGRATGGHQHAS